MMNETLAAKRAGNKLKKQTPYSKILKMWRGGWDLPSGKQLRKITAALRVLWICNGEHDYDSKPSSRSSCTIHASRNVFWRTAVQCHKHGWVALCERDWGGVLRQRCQSAEEKWCLAPGSQFSVSCKHRLGSKKCQQQISVLSPGFLLQGLQAR